ncbi:MAG: PAS domain S-box protein [Sterolibacterium sp.]
MKATHKLIASLAGAALLGVLGVTVTFWTFEQIEEAAAQRKHTFVVLTAAEDLLSSLKDAETGQRGYLLTGDEAFLKPYLAVRSGFDDQLNKLRQLASISTARQHADALAPLIDARLIELSLAIELRRNKETAAALTSVRSGYGKQLMDSIRAEIHSLIRIEEEALAQHDVQFQTDMRRLFILIIEGSLLILLLSLWAVLAVFREARQRLEHRVHVETQNALELREKMNLQLQQANVILKENTEKLSVTLNCIGDAVIASDAEMRVTLLNPLAERLTGWSQEQAHGLPVEEIFRIVSQETRQPVPTPIRKTLALGTTEALPSHTLLLARDGSEHAIADTCAPIRDLGDQIVGAVLVFRDVTKEYAAQQVARDHAVQIQTILNSVADGIVTIQARGGIIETVNPAAVRIFGYAAEDLIGQYFSLLIPELDRDQRNGSLEYYAANAEDRASGREREVVGQRKNGSFFPLQMTVSEMWLSGQRYFTGILHDISART